eukprot:gnl/MRDRNA2_/MRDRNA2_93713_c0_seq1.p1 gnl/MRDRNA2_/MRDRNA2_93713_c0~~gnl/MRDRNA2_/MRDRNA2_93713_c0_seq1.p1  ORF type:complete len:344 (+),score=42.92 gnl/MRDRNA2_/MRDRNA2_93713_c0_seq1:93-1124(+)
MRGCFKCSARCKQHLWAICCEQTLAGLSPASTAKSFCTGSRSRSLVHEKILFEAPGIGRHCAVPTLQRVHTACFLNTVGLGAMLHAAHEYASIAFEPLAVVGLVVFMFNIQHQNHQAARLNQMLARHVTRLKLHGGAVGSADLHVECEQLIVDGSMLTLGEAKIRCMTRSFALNPIESGGVSFGALCRRRLLHLHPFGAVRDYDTLVSLGSLRLQEERRDGVVRIAMPGVLPNIQCQPNTLVESIARSSVVFSLGWNLTAGSVFVFAQVATQDEGFLDPVREQYEDLWWRRAWRHHVLGEPVEEIDEDVGGEQWWQSSGEQWGQHISEFTTKLGSKVRSMMQL